MTCSRYYAVDIKFKHYRNYIFSILVCLSIFEYNIQIEYKVEHKEDLIICKNELNILYYIL